MALNAARARARARRANLQCHHFYLTDFIDYRAIWMGARSERKVEGENSRRRSRAPCSLLDYVKYHSLRIVVSNCISEYTRYK